MEWIHRSFNERADYLSKIVDNDDWGISKEIMSMKCHKKEIEELPEVLVDKVDLLPGVLRRPRADNTCKKYESAFFRWKKWALFSNRFKDSHQWVSESAKDGHIKDNLEERLSVFSALADVPPECNPWSPWGDCTPAKPYTFGTRQRNRMCSEQPNTNCYGDSIETKPCENPCITTPAQCENGMVWSECGNRCPHTRIDVRPGTCTEDDGDECVPGCTCPDGKVLYDGECVLKRKCPCYDEDGNAVLPGFEVNVGPCETCVLLNGDPYSCGEKVDTGECPRKPCPADCKIRGIPYHIGDVTKEEGCEVCHCTTQGEQCENDTHAIVDGNWSSWSEWSTCSRSCDGGVTNRYRQCNDPLPQCGGAPCKGRNSNTKPCNNDVSCCEVTAFSQWSECSATCDRGTRTRERAYKSQADTSVCDKVLQGTETCLEHECDMKCNVSQWSEWSDCSEDCGIGRKTRTRNVRGPKFPDCPNLTDSAVCYEKSCRCGPNEEFSNHTLCEHTCASRFDGPPADCEEKLKDGCICEDDYYRDENGDCVKINECDKCYVDGEYKKPGETWTSGENECSACECIAGAVKCSPVCEIPTCEEDETLSYEGPNPCCPRCVKRTDSCRQYTRKDFLQDSAHKCRSASKIDFSYCEGSCGNSTSMPMLFSKPNNNMLDNDCRCCTADVSHYDEVNVLCGEGMNQSLKTAFFPVVVGCRCQPCQEVTENPIVKGR
ncbi:SCO-spondin-like [Mercenaria mercenaria]|uniref:SCO-spondin-like n=1 Tax=Mercenaria mercenaria TaxID=6596 RepID=UPI00234E7682|nr:SCO-spondin-like [Mercenaria mercenaria]